MKNKELEIIANATALLLNHPQAELIGKICDETTDAYCYMNYGELLWSKAIADMLELRLSPDCIEWILRSKHARWARDQGIPDQLGSVYITSDCNDIKADLYPEFEADAALLKNPEPDGFTQTVLNTGGQEQVAITEVRSGGSVFCIGISDEDVVLYPCALDAWLDCPESDEVHLASLVGRF